MFHSILVATDGSSPAATAVKQAVDLARSEKASLTVLSAYNFNPPVVSSIGPAVVALDADEILAGLRDEAQEIVTEAVRDLDSQIPLRTLIVEDRPAHAILQEIAEGGHDLVVLGSRGRGALGSLVMGSVTHAVMHQAKVPMLITFH